MDANATNNIGANDRIDEGTRGRVKLAIFGVWTGIGLSALIALVDKLVGSISEATFVSQILVYGLICIIPYKLQQGSDAARYWLLVLTVAGTLLELGGVGQTPRLDSIAGWLWTPVNLMIFYILFSKPGANYFAGRR